MSTEYTSKIIYGVTYRPDQFDFDDYQCRMLEVWGDIDGRHFFGIDASPALIQFSSDTLPKVENYLKHMFFQELEKVQRTAVLPIVDIEPVFHHFVWSY